MRSLNVMLLQGGQSAEREVSLNSGAAVHQALLALGHQVTVVDGFSALKKQQAEVDVVFNMLHGADGEDGQLAAWLNLEGYVSTCCDFAATSVTWHKDQAKAIVAEAGLLTPKAQLLKHHDDLKIVGDGPWIVKPATEGSSVGLYKANDAQALKQAVNEAFHTADELLVEAFIDGVECTVGIVGNDVLPVVSINPASELYDYHAKYMSQSTEYHCPADFSLEWQEALQQDAKLAYETLKIKGWCRVDFIIDNQGRRWFLEVNTTPGMTNNSLLPKAAAVHGWSFVDLVARILATAYVSEGAADE
ncbi:D-alanine--D-alanine ligase [Marinicella sp. S1101]|uniref:D-alanine--D-alanine ligase family protein n=1 Tax=Marinicella marina TaxID=2996016 RepID=UPI002260CD64|nr:D-alanine--D-alanine ligase [Marinicella marina]MCX7553885.1 D-alanine--D-alanine ligase [Marinicella marina]MDJ1140377.1 D-alanine--D-alanine ligase [Marinicella marina]